MHLDTLCKAVADKKRVSLRYDNYSRLVEVHTCGKLTTGEMAARVWQVSGGSVSGERSGWKMLHLDEITGVRIVDEISSAPRKGYKRGDRAFEVIRCQV